MEQKRCCEIAHFYLIMELVGFNKTSPAAKLKVTFIFLWQTTFYQVTSKLVSVHSTNQKKRSASTHILNIFAIFLYAQQQDDTAGRISSNIYFYDNNSFLIRIMFTCNISLQKIQLFTFTVIFPNDDYEFKFIGLKPIPFTYLVLFTFYIRSKTRKRI